MQTHPDIGLMTATCSKSAAGLLQLARFWLCMLNMFIYLETKCYIKSIIQTMLEPIENWGVFPIFLID